MQRQHTATVASEADRLEAAIAAAGLDPSAGESYPIWTLWQQKGICAALSALQEETDMNAQHKGPGRWQHDPTPGHDDLSPSEKALIARGGAVRFELQPDGSYRKTLEQSNTGAAAQAVREAKATIARIDRTLRK